MPQLLLIDGLVNHPETTWEQLCPNLARLAASGHHGTLTSSNSTTPLAHLFGLTTQNNHDLPLGFYAALAAGLQPDPNRTWALLGLTHLKQHRDKLLLVSPERTGQSPDEITTLTTALMEEWSPLGWTQHQTIQGVTILSTAQPITVQTSSLDGLDAASMADHLPQGADAFTLSKLLNDGQMALRNHPINHQRQASGRLTLNTPWLWGIGSGHPVAEKPTRGLCWSNQLPILGMAQTDGFTPCLLPNGLENLYSLLPQFHSPGVLCLHSPRIFAQHGMINEWRERLQAIDQILIAPLLERSQSEQLIVSGITPWPNTTTVPWIATAPGVLHRLRQRLWHRDDPLQTWTQARAKWLS